MPIRARMAPQEPPQGREAYMRRLGERIGVPNPQDREAYMRQLEDRLRKSMARSGQQYGQPGMAGVEVAPLYGPEEIPGYEPPPDQFPSFMPPRGDFYRTEPRSRPDPATPPDVPVPDTTQVPDVEKGPGLGAERPQEFVGPRERTIPARDFSDDFMQGGLGRPPTQKPVERNAVDEFGLVVGNIRRDLLGMPTSDHDPSLYPPGSEGLPDLAGVERPRELSERIRDTTQPLSFQPPVPIGMYPQLAGLAAVDREVNRYQKQLDTYEELSGGPDLAARRAEEKRGGSTGFDRTKYSGEVGELSKVSGFGREYAPREGGMTGPQATAELLGKSRQDRLASQIGTLTRDGYWWQQLGYSDRPSQALETVMQVGQTAVTSARGALGLGVTMSQPLAAGAGVDWESEVAIPAGRVDEKMRELAETIYPPEWKTSFTDTYKRGGDVVDFVADALREGLVSTLAILAGGVAGGNAGMILAAYALNHPEVIDELMQGGMPYEDAVRHAFIPTLAVAAFDTALPGMLKNKIVGGKQLAGDALETALRNARIQARRSAIDRYVSAFAAGAFVEAPTEGTQELITIGTGIFHGDRSLSDLPLDEYADRTLNATMAGAVGGGGARVAAEPLAQRRAKHGGQAYETFAAGGAFGQEVQGEVIEESILKRPEDDLYREEQELRSVAGEFGTTQQARVEQRRGIAPGTQAAGVAEAAEAATAPPASTPKAGREPEDYVERGEDTGPPEGVTERRYTPEEIEEFDAPGRKAAEDELATFLSGTLGHGLTGFKEMPEDRQTNILWASEEYQKVAKDEGAEAANAWAGRVSMSIYDNRTLDELKSTWGHTPGEVTSERKAATTPIGEVDFADDVTPIVRMKGSEMDVEEGVQYKMYGAAARSEGLADVDVWSDALAGIVTAWAGTDANNLFPRPKVINGHNRRARAIELGDPAFPVRLVLAKNVEKARFLGAVANIGENQGTAFDAAEFFKGGGFETLDDIREVGLSPKRQMARDGFALSRLNADLYLYALQNSDDATKLNRMIVLGNAELTHEQQGSIFKVMGELGGLPSATELALLIDRIKGQGEVQSDDTQMGMFGDTDHVDTQLQILRVEAAVASKIGRLQTHGKRTKAEAAVGEELGTVKTDLDAVGELLENVEAIKAAWKLASRTNPEIEDRVREAGREMAGKSRKADRSKIEKRVANEIFESIQADLEAAREEGSELVSEERGEATEPGPDQPTERGGGPGVAEAAPDYAAEQGTELEVVTPEVVSAPDEVWEVDEIIRPSDKRWKWTPTLGTMAEQKVREQLSTARSELDRAEAREASNEDIDAYVARVEYLEGVQDHLFELRAAYSDANRIALRGGKEPTSFWYTESWDPVTGRVKMGSAPTTATKERMAGEMHEEWAEVDAARERAQTEPVPDVMSFPGTKGFGYRKGHYKSLAAALDDLRAAIPTRKKDVTPELAEEIKNLVRYIQTQPRWIQHASREEVAGLLWILNAVPNGNPLFSDDRTRNAPFGIKWFLTVKASVIEELRARGGKWAELRQEEVTRYPEKSRKYYHIDKHGEEFEWDQAQVKWEVDPNDPYTTSKIELVSQLKERQKALDNVDAGLTAFEGATKLEPSDDLAPPGGFGPQMDAFGEEFEEEVDEGPDQGELDLSPSQTQETMYNARRILTDLFPLWLGQRHTRAQAEDILSAMIVIQHYFEESDWGFTQKQVDGVRASSRSARVREAEGQQYFEVGEDMAAPSLNPAHGTGALVGGLLDRGPSELLPHAGKYQDDAELAKKYQDIEDKQGVTGLMRMLRKRQLNRGAAKRLVEKSLMVPINTGRGRVLRSLGRFFSNIRSIWTKEKYDLETIGHEVGHALQALVFGPRAYTPSGALSNQVFDPWAAELKPFIAEYDAYQGKGPNDRSSTKTEGFAEWLRVWIVDPERATKLAPRLTKFVFESLQKHDADVADMLSSFAELYKHYRNLTPTAHMLAQTKWDNRPPRRGRGFWRQAMIDRRYPIERFWQMLNPGASLTDMSTPIEEMPHMQAHLMSGDMARSDDFWENGFMDLETGDRLSRGAGQIIRTLVDALEARGINEHETLLLLEAHGVARRTIERTQQVIERTQKRADELNRKWKVKGKYVVQEWGPGEFGILNTANNRFVGKREKQMTTGHSRSQAQLHLKAMDKRGIGAELNAAMDEFGKFFAAQMQWAVNEGILTEIERGRITEHSYWYVPMIDADHQYQEYKLGPSYKRMSAVNVAESYKRMTGTAGMKMPWVIAAYEQVHSRVSNAARTRVGQTFYQMLKEKGTAVWAEVLVTPTRTMPMSLEQVVATLEQHLGKERVETLRDELKKEELTDILLFYQPDVFREANIVRVKDPETGDSRFVQINDVPLWEALMGIEHLVPDHILFNFVGMPAIANSLRMGATMAPGFSLFRNPARDSTMSWIFSEWGIRWGYDHTRALYHLLRGTLDPTKRTKRFEEFNVSRAAFASILDTGRKGHITKLKAAQMSDIRHVVADKIELMKLIGTYTENVNRMAEFVRAMDTMEGMKEGDTLEHDWLTTRVRVNRGGHGNALPYREMLDRAGYAARDLSVDFGRHGNATAAMRMMAAFWNANLQGYDKMYRTFKESPQRTAMRTWWGITLPTILLMAVNMDDEDYWDLPGWLRDFYWLIPVNTGTVLGGAAGLVAGAMAGNPAVAAAFIAGGGLLNNLLDEKDQLAGEPEGTYWDGVLDPMKRLPVIGGERKYWIKIPKPFILGQIGGSLIERILFEMFGGEDSSTFTEWGQELLTNEAKSLTPLPTWIRPIWENFAMRSLWQNRPLIGPEVAQQDRWRQYTAGTSQFSRWVGETSHKITGTQGVAPWQLDNIIYGWGGTLMRDALRLSEAGFQTAGLLGRDAETTPEMVPLFRDVYQAWPYRASANVDEVYKLWKEADRKYRTYGAILKEKMASDPDAALEYLDRNPGLFEDYHTVAVGYATMGVLNQTYRLIENDPQMPDKEKKRQIWDIWQQRNDVAKHIIQRVTPADRQ